MYATAPTKANIIANHPTHPGSGGGLSRSKWEVVAHVACLFAFRERRQGKAKFWQFQGRSLEFSRFFDASKRPWSLYL